MEEIAVWTEPRADSNCYLLGEDGACVVIDPNDPQGLLGELERLAWIPEIIFLTHEHCDHIAGLEPLRARYPAARVIATASCSAGIQDQRLNMSRMMELYLTLQGKHGLSYPPFVCRPADCVYTEPYEFIWRSHKLRCLPLPGHTPGSCGILLNENTFFSGDYLIQGDPVLLRLPGGSEADYKAHTRPFLAGLRPGLRICPGHGVPFMLSWKDLKEHGLDRSAEN